MLTGFRAFTFQGIGIVRLLRLLVVVADAAAAAGKCCSLTSILFA